MIRNALAGASLCLLVSGAFAATDYPSGYTKCAQVGGSCSMSGTHSVALGKSGSFVYATLTGNFTCSPSLFPSSSYPSSAWCSIGPASSGSSSSVTSSSSRSSSSSSKPASSSSSSSSSSKSSSSSSRASSSSGTAAWTSSDRWGTWTNNGYTLYNNIWGSGYGSQTIWANSYSNWGVTANHPNTGGIKSYPNVTRNVGKKISAIGTLSSSFSANTPSGGAWESTYDIWDSNNKYEIMLWMNYTGNADGSGNVKPIAAQYDSSGKAVPAYTNVSVGGSTWNVFKGNNGANDVFSFLRTSKTNSATVDVKAILNWIKSKGWMGDVTMGNFQFGFEITSTSGTSSFTVNSYSLTSN